MIKNKIQNIQQAGFTLIEVLIAITILAFMTLAINVFTENAIDTSIKITAEDIESLQIETAMSRMEWDISHLYSPLYHDHLMDPQGMTPQEGEIYNQLADYYQNNSRFAFLTYFGHPVPIIQNEDKSTLVFFTSSNRRKIKNIKQSHFTWVKYELVNDNLSDEEKELVKEPTKMLIRKIYAENNYGEREIDWEDVKSQVLMHKITNLKFEFWDPEKKKWGDNLDIIKNGNHMIRALRVSLSYFDPSNIEVLSVRIFRPLYPDFEPEDMYKFLKGNSEGAGAGNALNGGPDKEDEDEDDEGEGDE